MFVDIFLSPKIFSINKYFYNLMYLSIFKSYNIMPKLALYLCNKLHLRNKFDVKGWDYSDSFKGHDRDWDAYNWLTHVACWCNEMVSNALSHFDMQEIYWYYRLIYSTGTARTLLQFWCFDLLIFIVVVELPGLWFWCWCRGPSIFFLFQTGCPGSLYTDRLR